ncbi:cardiolipin synthase [Mangrovimonas sp. DI 80]|uniref:cardiolipin synthase n=1 Tax=Mangrovimonas sp. DI 80 TaxID=1779330 RepID=UPI00097747FA|nr:cardiolipin synthase [Mangrovimonas sp. DI 80]OMP31250.1 cardiolipin synthase [Mangrovimonas sp. DI 80]
MIEIVKDNFWTIILVLNYLLAASAAATILSKNINPTKTISYILTLVFFPFLGLIVYYFFGQEYRKNKIFNRKHILNQNIIKSLERDFELDFGQRIKLDHFLGDKIKLVNLLKKSENSPLTLKNDVELLINGDVTFDYLFKDLKAAEDHIHLEYYIFNDDDIGSEIIDILCEKANKGLSVRFSFDSVGSKLSRVTRKKLRESGVEFYPFMPVLFKKFTSKMNYRDHRKIVIIDGKVGYLGGINVADNYLNNRKENKHFWRDTHIKLTGEAVKPLQVHFLTNWEFVSGQTFKVSKNLFPEAVATNGEVAVQIAASGPDTDWANIMEAIFTAINTADEYVYITTPYFIPNEQIITALQVAAKSGVDVRLLIPKISDSWTAKYASNSYLETLMEADVKVYRYTKGIIHAKTITVDGVFSSIGTSNMDYRSFNINFEINALIYNKELSRQLENQFMEDLKDAERVDFERWKARPFHQRAKEAYCRLWSPLL